MSDIACVMLGACLMGIITALAENVDGTSTTSLEWTVPEVFPTSKIYFLQFSADPVTTPQWTTRFTVSTLPI